MKKLPVLLTGALLAVSGVAFSSPAWAQVSMQNNQDDKALTRRTDEEKRQDAEIDRQYRATLRQSGGNAAAAKTDPWGSVRGGATSGKPAQRR